MAPPIFYHTPASPVSRGALLASRMLGVNVEVKNVNLFTLEHLTPEYLKLNPLHTVPTLDDNGHVVVDSHAIAIHLADKYGKNEKVYPKDINKRSIVNQQLFFNAGVLFRRLHDISFPIFFHKLDTIAEEKKTKVHEALTWLDGYLKPTGWVAGDHITIADCLCVSAVTSYAALSFDLSKYPNVKSWVENCRKTIPDFDAIDKVGVDVFRSGVKAILKPGEI